MSRHHTPQAFTLIEMLVVLFLIATLAAMLFPVFAGVRGRARQASCASNLRQLGQAIAMYAQDNDDLYPWGADPSDKFTSIWDVDPMTDPTLLSMPMLQDTLTPYVKNREVWRCPSDIGFDTLELKLGEDGKPIPLRARPSAFAAFGTSYFYRTELAFRHKLHGASVYGPGAPYPEYGTDQLPVLTDASGGWHGGTTLDDWRYNTLMGDGHVTNQDWYQHFRSWSLTLQPGG